MTTGEQITALSKDLQAVLDRYRQEFQIPIAGYVGVLALLQMDIHMYVNQCTCDTDDEDDAGTEEWKNQDDE